MVPGATTCPGGKPVIEVGPFGERPRSPWTVLEPVLLTAAAAKTAKLFAVPSVGATCAHAAGRSVVKKTSTMNRAVSRWRVDSRIGFLILFPKSWEIQPVWYRF